MDIFQRTIQGVIYSAGANFFRIIVLFIRAIVLANLLPIETFGTYSLSMSIVTLTSLMGTSGLDQAFLHRNEESADEEAAAATHFTLNSLAIGIWVIALSIVNLIWVPTHLSFVVWTLIGSTAVVNFSQTHRIMLRRRIIHRRLALLDFSDTVLTTAAAVAIALWLNSIWALLAVNIIGAALTLFFLVFWKPVWKMQLRWSPSANRYFLRFGGQSYLAKMAGRIVERLDDFWVGTVLGETALGIYSRAYTFANYPVQILGVPIFSVTGGSFAELKDRPAEMSRLFFNSTKLLIISSFFLAGMLAFTAPEFVAVLLGEKWLPMVTPFRLMLVYTMINPLEAIAAQLLLATGNPRQLLTARLIQLFILAVGLFTLGTVYKVIGVAVTINVMLLIGIGYLFWRGRKLIEISLGRLFAWPSIALTAALGSGLLLEQGVTTPENDVFLFAVKIVWYLIIYLIVLLLFERQELLRFGQLLTAAAGRLSTKSK